MANANETVHTNIKFKDRLFRIVFGAEENKKHLISLYNALNGTDFGESEMVEITTLDDAIYIRMKNDGRLHVIPLHVAVSQLDLSEEDFVQQAMSFDIFIKR